jgi:hypothetical protein
MGCGYCGELHCISWFFSVCVCVWLELFVYRKDSILKLFNSYDNL